MIKTKTEEVEVSIEVDADYFEIFELIQSISSRISELDADDIIELTKILRKRTIDNDGFIFEYKTLDEEMKLEHFEKVWQKYSLSEIQNKLP